MLSQLLALEKRLFKKADNWSGKLMAEAAMDGGVPQQGRGSPAAAAVSHSLPLTLHGYTSAADLLIKETQRRNTFLLYAEAPAAGAPTAEAEATAGPLQPARTHKQRGRGKSAASPQQQLPAAVVGYIIFTTTGLNAHISKLAVAAEWRRRGIARALVRSAVAAALAERRVTSVSLHVDADNSPALELYLSEGFASEALLEVRKQLCFWSTRVLCQLLAALHAHAPHSARAFTPASAHYRARRVTHPRPQSPQGLQDYYCRGRHAHKMRLDLDSGL